VPITKTEADLLELMRADLVMLNERLAVQTAVDLEASRENIAPRRVKRDLTEKVLKVWPEQSGRKIAETVGVSHPAPASPPAKKPTAPPKRPKKSTCPTPKI
jgi:hypothetical protein